MSVLICFAPAEGPAQAIAHRLVPLLGPLARAVSVGDIPTYSTISRPDLIVLGVEVGHEAPLRTFVAAHEPELQGAQVALFTVWPALPPIRDGLGPVRQALGSALLFERALRLRPDRTVDEAAVDVFATDLVEVAGRSLPATALRQRIENFLASQPVAVLATSLRDEPRATPVEYRNRGLDLILQTEGGHKLPRLRGNPRVSVAIYDPKAHEAGLYRSVQLTGLARLLPPGSDEAQAAEAIYPRRQKIEPGVHADDPRPVVHDRSLILVETVEATLIDLDLRQTGHRVRQTWGADPPERPTASGR